MQGRSEKEFTKRCKLCGDEFTTTSPRRIYCETCSPLVFKARASCSHREYADEAKRESDVMRLALKYLETVERESGCEETHVCPTCGESIPMTKRFCSTCLHNGYDGLHAVTGWTNGWDKQKIGDFKVVGGWRGQPRAGFGSSSNKSQNK